MAADNACSNRLSSLKFVGDTLSVSALISLVTLTFDLLTSNLLCVIARGVGNFSTNFGVSETFRSRLTTYLSDGTRDLLTLRLWPLTLEATALVGDTGTVIQVFVLHLCTKFAVRIGSFSFGRYDTLLISALDDLVTLTFALLTLKRVRVVARWVVNLPTSFVYVVFLGLFVL